MSLLPPVGNRWHVRTGVKLPEKFRLRGHPPLFDWEEARRRVKKGETHAAVAKSMGVDRRSVSRVVHMSAARVKAAMDRDGLAQVPLYTDKVPCPRCGRPKNKDAKQCRDCANETKAFAPTTLVRIPGIGKTELRNVETHRIVRVGERWGVLVPTPRGGYTGGWRLVDF